MKLIAIIYYGLSNLIYLKTSNHSSRNKFKIFFTLIKINLKFIFFAKLFNLKREKIFGYRIDAFDYGTIRYLFEEIFYKNEYFFNAKTNDPIIFDCGANIGLATIFFKWLYPESTVYSFEPDKKTFELLQKNISQNKLNKVHLFNSALSDRNGTIDFYIDSKNPGSLIMSTKQERMSKDKISVNCLSLSSFIENNKLSNVDFVKMDIEGSENEVAWDLSRSKKLKNINKFSIEYHHKINSSNKSKLGEFLQIFELNGFDYQVDAKNTPCNSENKFQDILLYIYK